MLKFLKGCLTAIGGFVALVVVAALILGGNGKRQGTPSASISADTPAASSAPTQEIVAVGVLSNVREDRAIQVNSSEIVDQITAAN